MRANRKAADLSSSESGPADHSALDNLLEKLRNGDSAGRKTRRNRGHKPTPSQLALEPSTSEEFLDDTSDKAKELLARLKSGVLDAPFSGVPSSPRKPRHSTTRRARLRMGDISMGASPVEEESEYDVDELDTQPSSADWDASGMTQSHSRSSSTSDALNEYMRARRGGSESATVSPRLETQPEEAEHGEP